MPRTPLPPPADRTPQARLGEADLHGVLGYQLAQASIVTSEVFVDAVGRPCDMRPVEYTVLALIDANPGLTARQLARALAVTPPNIAAWLERLEARHLIARRRSDSDARVQHLQATAAGHTLAANCTQRLLRAEQTAMAGLSAAERAMLVELVHKVALARGRTASR
jgi:DNA-binding MarR family transcriptional regulator